MVPEHAVAMTSQGHLVSCREDQTILDAYLRAGVWMPHSCTQGTCGTCKIQVVQGDVSRQAGTEYAITSSEIGEGKALACQTVPSSDVMFEPARAWTNDESFDRFPLRDYKATVAELEDVARDTRRLVVALDAPMPFNAGQYADIEIADTGITRAYSMASAPTEASRLEFHIRRLPGGAASERWVFSTLAVGDRIRLSGPLGNFHFHDQRTQPAILIGGGTGLAPLKSIVLHTLSTPPAARLYLYHGVRQEQDLYDIEFFRNLETAHPGRFSYHPCLSEGTWDGATGTVTDAVASDFATCKGARAYVCGPPAMIDAALTILKRKRMPPRNVFREKFYQSAAIPC